MNDIIFNLISVNKNKWEQSRINNNIWGYMNKWEYVNIKKNIKNNNEIKMRMHE